MKKLIALLLAALLLVGVTACGDDTYKPEEDTASTAVTTQPIGTTTTSATEATTESLPTGAIVPIGTKPTAAVTILPSDTTSTTVAPTTTEALPTGATVPIGSKPTTTGTTEVPTTTYTEAEDPNVGSSTAATDATTTDTTTPPTTTAPTVKPTEPQGPYIVLPAVGSDIDVTKKKDRIRISGVAAWFNEDGTIGVQLTFRNYSSNWITEETDYINYTCYDKNGKVVQKSTQLVIGVIDTKRNIEKSYVFDVPANTAEVKITKSKIVYWTEWA